MINGLVLGKFMPLHHGHMALIDFAAKQCDQLFILLCHTKKEPIPGHLRESWLRASVSHYAGARVISYEYNDADLPNTSVSSRETSFLWSQAIKERLPDIDVVFTSEEYGAYMSEFMRIRHIPFDI